jgi:uncharacterized protein
MLFLADGMLGKLARWLRMLGQDVTYSVKLSDNELLMLAKSEQRALLTRDFELYKRAVCRGLDAYYVEGKTESERLAEISKRYGIKLAIDMDQAHCPVCNHKLQATTKEQLKEELQPGTYANYDKFWKCPNCGQVYWQGAHWKQIQQTLQRTQKRSLNG